jgi:sulfur-oxidizing protein SoxX
MTRNFLLLAGTAVLVAGCAAPLPVGERPKLVAADLDQLVAVSKRDFRARGIAGMDRVELDAALRTCNLYNDNPPREVAQPLEEQILKTIPFPQGSLIGDWKRGQSLAQSGRGMTWSDKPGTANGGSCYNCHQLSPQEESFGTLGTSLRNFGKIRGTSEAIQRYTYGKIYNSKAYNLCSQMPRMGHSKTLTEQQIKDLTAYLLDPNSPVNK